MMQILAKPVDHAFVIDANAPGAYEFLHAKPNAENRKLAMEAVKRFNENRTRLEKERAEIKCDTETK